MSRRYSIDHEAVPNTDNTTQLYFAVNATPSTRPALYELLLGSRATPADQACAYEIQRFTAENGTPGGTAVTPQAIDPADPAASSNAVADPSGEPTYTANAILLKFSTHQRTLFRWVAAPGGELVAPATADNGLGLLADTPTTAYNVEPCMHFEE